MRTDRARISLRSSGLRLLIDRGRELPKPFGKQAAAESAHKPRPAPVQPTAEPLAGFSEPDRKFPRHPEREEITSDECNQTGVGRIGTFHIDADNDRNRLSDGDAHDEDDEQPHDESSQCLTVHWKS